MKILGKDEKQMRDMYREEAQTTVKTELVLDEIVKAEDIKADEADVDKLLEGYATAMNQSLEDLKKSFDAGQMEYFQHRAQVTKALDMLWDNAKVTDEEPKAEEKAEDKPEA